MNSRLVPYLIALFLCLLVIALLPKTVAPWLLVPDPLSRGMLEDNTLYYTADRGDGGNSEFFRLKNNRAGGESVVTESQYLTPVQQIDYRGTTIHTARYAVTADLDKNGHTDIAWLTHFKDTIYLAMAWDAWEKKDSVSYLAIDRYVPDLKETANNFLSDLTDLDGDGEQEFIVLLNAGYQISPRALYIVSWKTGQVIRSETGINTLSYLGSWDIDQDQKKEIFLDNKAQMNQAPGELTELSDYEARFTILTAEGQPKYPVNLTHQGPYNRISTLPAVMGTDTLVMGLFHSANQPSFLIYYHPETHQADTVKTYKNDTLPIGLSIQHIFRPGEYVFGASDGQTFHFKNGQLRRTGHLGRSQNIRPLLLAGLFPHPVMAVWNNTDQFLYLANARRFLTNGLKIPCPPEQSFIYHVSPATILGKPGVLVQTGQSMQIATVRPNPWFYLRYPAYVLSWLLLALAIYLIQRQQKRALLKKQQLRDEILTLQFRAINNQLNPHFNFNMLNIIGYSILHDERERAYHMLTEYARLTRELVESGSEITTRLYTEIRFLENYLSLQKIRFERTLEYTIDIDHRVDQSVLIPKMILHTFVENAIKHGLSQLETSRRLLISVYPEGQGIRAVIEDNGSGFDPGKPRTTDSTGKGLEILSQILTLFKKLTGREVRYQIINLSNAYTDRKGTRVIVDFS